MVWKSFIQRKKLSGTHDNEYRLIRSWWVEDCANNEASHIQTLVIQDTSAPVLTRLEPDITTECDCDTSVEGFNIEALDNCDGIREVTLTVAKINGISDDFYTVYRTWFSIDISGNSVEHIQTVTVVDNTVPEWCDAIPKNMDYNQCDDVPSAPELKAKDECDPSVSVTYHETRKNLECSHNYILEREWIAVDRSGNQISHKSTIQVEDSISPTLLNLDEKFCLWPANGMIAVYARASETLIDVVDNCGSVESMIKSCNSSEVDTSRTDCAYNALNDVLYVRIEQTSGSGREYRIHSSNNDECGNSKNGFKKIWIPPSQEAYDSAINNDECSGTGADNYISSMPE